MDVWQVWISSIAVVDGFRNGSSVLLRESRGKRLVQYIRFLADLDHHLKFVVQKIKGRTLYR